MILYEDMKWKQWLLYNETDWTRSASFDMGSLSPDVRMQTLVMFILLDTLLLLMNLSLQKKQI